MDVLAIIKFILTWRLLVFVGYVARLYYHYSSADYPFSFKTPEGRKNIRKSTFSIFPVTVFWIIWVAVPIQEPLAWWQMILVLLLQPGSGWAGDSLWLAFMDIQEKGAVGIFKLAWDKITSLFSKGGDKDKAPEEPKQNQ